MPTLVEKKRRKQDLTEELCDALSYKAPNYLSPSCEPEIARQAVQDRERWRSPMTKHFPILYSA